MCSQLLRPLVAASVCSILLSGLDAKADSGVSPAGYSRNEVGDFDSPGGLGSQSADSFEIAAEYAIKHKNFVQGIKWLEMNLERHPGDPTSTDSLCKAHIAYGDYLYKQQKIEDALLEYKNALEVDKSSPEAASKLKNLETSK